MKRQPEEFTIDRDLSPAVTGVVLGILVDFTGDGAPLVDYPGNPASSLVPSRSTVVLAEQDRGRDLALVFEGSDLGRPIIIGLIQPAIPATARLSSQRRATRLNEKIHATVDGKRIEIEGEDEIVLRCGGASITLRRNGRIVIRGDYVESRSKGVNRIKGGSVLIN
jgi:hypothetical protein